MSARYERPTMELRWIHRYAVGYLIEAGPLQQNVKEQPIYRRVLQQKFIVQDGEPFAIRAMEGGMPPNTEWINPLKLDAIGFNAIHTKEEWRDVPTVQT